MVRKVVDERNEYAQSVVFACGPRLILGHQIDVVVLDLCCCWLMWKRGGWCFAAGGWESTPAQALYNPC